MNLISDHKPKKFFQKLESDVPKVPKQSDTKYDGLINQQIQF